MKSKNSDMQKTSEKIAGKVASFILKMQDKWVGFMKRRTDHLSIAAQKKWLFAFVGMFGGFCCYLIIGGLGKNPKQLTAPPSAIMIPKLQGDKLPVGEAADSLIVNTVREYYHKRDSLLRTAPEQWQWIIDNRPGLIDSVEQLEQYIQSNGLYRP